MINIKYKSVLIICIFLVVLSLNAVCASDVNQTNDQIAIDNDSNIQTIENGADVEAAPDNEILAVDSEDNAVASSASSVVATSSKTSSNSVFIKNTNFVIRILDDNGVGIANKQVQVDFKTVTKNLTTNSKGYVYLNLNALGTYTIKYTFKADGYETVSGSKKVTVVGDSTSKLPGSSKYVAYVGINNPYVVTLKTGGIKMQGKKVVFKVNGKTYSKKTNSNGKATLNINLPKGTYALKCIFYGLKNAKSATKSVKVTVKKGSPTRLVLQKSIEYLHQTAAPFILKYRDAHGNPIPNKVIVFKINGKTYSKKTDKNGQVTFTIKQKRGIYKATASSYNTAYLKSTKNTYTIKVKSDSTNNNGFWLFGSDMKDVDLSQVVKYGTNHIFLNYYAIEHFGKSAVADFATEAKSLGIKVHIWMQAFNDGGWISPVNSDGTYKYSLFNSIIKKAKEYAAIDGVAGIHFDYLRFPGTAYKHTNGVAAINYFTKTACTELHKMNPDLIVSAAIMPEPSSDKYYYGQDIPTLSKYLDVLVPMVYKGNYGKDASWIKSVTSTFVSQSNGADVWTGLQGYVSDSNVKKLSASTLKNDAKYAGYGGANGVIIFRYSLFNFFNFDEL